MGCSSSEGGKKDPLTHKDWQPSMLALKKKNCPQQKVFLCKGMDNLYTWKIQMDKKKYHQKEHSENITLVCMFCIISDRKGILT